MKRFLSIALALVLVLALSVTAVYAAAEDRQGEYDWYVHFTPDADMEESFPELGRESGSLKMADILSGLQPGDTATFHMELRNDNAATTDWYMTNEVFESLEYQRRAAGQGAYTYQLVYEGPGGRNVLFDSNTVGGTQDYSELQGLEQATISLEEEYTYLDTLATGQSGNITLVVALDGETQGNAYQDTLARLQMNFAVELHRTTPGRNDITWRPVRTGDETNLMLWSGIMLGCGIAALALGIVVLRRNRRNREENEDE